MSQSMPPPLHGPPSEKERKYDRQLRLWAASGQAALENAHVLLVNSGTGVAGVETLKNLILPGIGQFTIVDSAQVTEADLGINFFLEEGDIGTFRAERTCALLNELNPDVNGHAISEPLEIFITKPDALAAYTFIIVVLPIQAEIHERIAAHAKQTDTPAFYIHCTGFYAQITAQLPRAFPIVNTHPDPTSISDVRLLEPWPELQSFMHDKTADLEQMDDEHHGHVPYVLLLLHYLDVWKSAHGGNNPSTYKEKVDFRSLVQNAARTKSPEGGEENYDEAVGAVLKSLTPPAPSSDVKAVFTAPECTQLSSNSASFWLIALAVSTFHRTQGVLPLSGALPDMKATSAVYVELQNVYKNKARADVASVTTTVRDLEKQLGRPETIPTREIENFCKSAAHVKLVRGRPPHVLRMAEDALWGDRAASLAAQLTEPDSLLLLYLAFLAWDTYEFTHDIAHAGSPPQRLTQPIQPATRTSLPVPASASSTEDGATTGQKITSIAHHHLDALIKAAGAFLEDPGYTNTRDALAQIVEELVRADNAELHNIAAVAGGVAAQEVIKVVTGQYVPVDNTWLYDGIRSVMNVLKI